VVGAGVLGANVAFRLVQAGAAVTLVDAVGPGAGTSSTSFGWVGASPRGLWEYFDLNVAGVAAHRRLRAELGTAPWLSDRGVLEWYRHPGAQERLDARIRELRDAGYPAAQLSSEHATRLEPDVVVPEDVDFVAFYPDEGYAYPLLMIAHVLAAARADGLAEQYGQRVTAVEEGSVELESGERLDGDVVVLCCGRWTGELSQLAGYAIPMVAPAKGSPAVGLLVRSVPVPTTLQRLLCADETMIRPDGGGRLLLHSDAHDVRLDPATGPEHELAGDLLATALRSLRTTGPARVESAQTGIRALTEDFLPAVGRLPGADGVYACVSHSGITLAAVLGELVAAEILGALEDPLLAGFRPSRFAGRTLAAIEGTKGGAE
jgi:glycine/D-amino acid oxidase-like deaminating enzyme